MPLRGGEQRVSGAWIQSSSFWMQAEARRAATYLVDRLLTLLVLLGLLLHLLPLLDVVDEREKVTQVDDERLRLDEDTEK